MKRCCEIRIRGIVQGVGFRPFVYNLALENNIVGHISNDTEGVKISAEGYLENINAFLDGIKNNPPPLATIISIETTDNPPFRFKEFTILKSTNTNIKETFIPPDTAVCDKCLEEILDEKNRRYNYPFTTCTNCGPRFSIINDIPYDRRKTAMADFSMCRNCSQEYIYPKNRRFHTQPNACGSCGPNLTLYDNSNNIVSFNTEEILKKTIELLKSGKIIALKGMGGFLLVADAKNKKAIKILRQRKGREDKPFALMAGNIESAEKFLEISEKQKEILLSKERPIVLLREKKKIVARNIAPGLSYLGIMLPYLPFQHMIFKEEMEQILVMTSGNVSNEPIIFNNEEALTKLANIADYFITYNREIVAHSDDSIIFTLKDNPYMIRRSRGYVPKPFITNKIEKQIFATGGDLKNSFAIAKNKITILSQYLGDMSSPKSNELYLKTYNHFKKIYNFVPDIIVSDMHPGYFTTTIADEMADHKITRVQVQHHHAHIASVLEEQNIDEEVIGIAFDGTGYGTDNTLWGSEFLICDKKQFSRVAHFKPFPLPGGENAIKDIWKIALSLLNLRYGENIPLMQKAPQKDIIFEIIKKQINSPLTSSIGRLFDGVSAILGIKKTVSYEAQGAIALEEVAMKSTKQNYNTPFIIPIERNKTIQLQTELLIEYIINLLKKDTRIEDVAYLFHLSIAETTIQMADLLREIYSINKVVLSGGVFQNKILLSLITEGLLRKKFDISLPQNIPFNDGGISLGQISIAKENLLKNGNN